MKILSKDWMISPAHGDKSFSYFIIGTNAYSRYMFAADRMNERVAYLYQPYPLILLSTIKSMIDKANKHGIIVSVCGEMAINKVYLIGLPIFNHVYKLNFEILISKQLMD